MKPALTSSARPPDLPAGLTVKEAVRISEAITAAHAESTRTVYDCVEPVGALVLHPRRHAAARGAGADLRVPH